MEMVRQEREDFIAMRAKQKQEDIELAKALSDAQFNLPYIGH